jgi:hypothetical protein
MRSTAYFMMVILICGCTVVRVRDVPGTRWTKVQTQELAGWWCSDRDKKLWRAELTAKGELLIGTISRRADDQFELMDSIAVPTRVGDRDMLCVRIKTKIESEAGYGFMLMRRDGIDKITLLFPNGDNIKQMVADGMINGKLLKYENSEQSLVYVAENDRSFIDALKDAPIDKIFDDRFKIELRRLKLP